VVDLLRAQQGLKAHLQTMSITDAEIAEIEVTCAEMPEGLEDKRRYFELLDVRGKLAVENGEKVAYVSCKIGKQQQALAAISPLLNIGAIETTNCVCLLTPRFL
jgi:hypothetical protein